MPNHLQAGYAALDITPPVGVDLAGFISRVGPSIGLRDPLSARALLLDDGQTRLLLIACDVLGFDAEFVRRIRARIAESTGIPAVNILLAATHTHSGPATTFLQDCGERDADYLHELERRLIALAAQAERSRQPASLEYGRGESAEGVHNRRTPGDAFDPEVGLLRVLRSDGSPLALVVNYVCHPTTLFFDNRLISADYPALVRSIIEKATAAPVIFFTGAIGDVGPVERGPASLERIGNAVARAALAALPGLERIDEPILSVRSERLTLPLLALPTPADLRALAADYENLMRQAEASGDALQAKIQGAMIGWTQRILAQHEAGAAYPAVTTEVQVIRIGDLAIVSAPGELFSELGLQIKREVGAKQVFVCGFANDSIGYIPARRAYPKGGYEVTDAYKFYGYPAALAPEAGEQLVESALRLAAHSQPT